MTSKTTSSIWKRIWRSSSRGVRAPSETRISPSLRPSPWRSCMSRARSKSASVILPVRSSSAPRGWGFDRISAKMMAPPSNEMVPALCRNSEVTRNTPVFRLRSRSWKTSWMPSSRSGPSIAMGQAASEAKMCFRSSAVRACARAACANGPPGLAPLLLLLVQSSQVEPHLDVTAIELQRRPVRGQRAGLVADLERDVSLQLVEIGAAGGAPLRLLQRGERSGGIASGGAPLRRGDERVHVVRRELEQLLRQRSRLLRARAAQGEQRLDLPEPRVGASGLEAACLAVALERLAVQAALREDVPKQHARVRAARAPLHGAHRLGSRDVHQALAHVVARQGQGVVRGLAGRRLRGGQGGELLEDVVQEALVEVEVFADRLRRHVGGNFRSDADRALLVLEVDRGGDLLGDVVGIELERPFGGAQRAVEVAQVGQREAQVVVGPRVVGVRLDGAHERVAGVRKALELHQHQSYAVPGGSGVRVAGEHLTVRREPQLEGA